MAQKISSVMVATRRIVNEETGIDLYVYDERRNIVSKRTIRATIYSVIIVSNLPEFRAKPGQTVQYTLDKSHEEFEKLHTNLSKKFSGTLFPEMPSKPIAIMDNADKKRERKIKLDKFVNFCAQTTKIAKSEILRKFLGVENLQVQEGDGDCEKQLMKNHDEQTKPSPVRTDLFEDSIDTKKDDLFRENDEQEEASISNEQGEDLLQTSRPVKLSSAKLYEDNLKEPDAVAIAANSEKDFEKTEDAEAEEDELFSEDDDSDDDFEQLMSRLEHAKKTRAEREKSLAEKSRLANLQQKQEKAKKGLDLGDLSADDVARYISENSVKMDELDLGL